MSKRQYGTLHPMNPSWNEDPDDLVTVVVKDYRYGKSMLDLARELWRLADNDQRAKQIDEVLAVAYAREPVILETQGIEQLLALLDGLDDPLRKAVLGPDDLVPVDCLPEARARTSLVDVDEDRGSTAKYGVAEALAEVWRLRDALEETLAHGLHLLID